MAPIWNKDDGLPSLLVSIIETSVLYAISLGSLIIIARLLVFLPRKYLSITTEATFKAWIACSAWLAISHLLAIYSLYDPANPLVSMLIWSMIAVCGLTLGIALAGGVVTLAVIICYKYL